MACVWAVNGFCRIKGKTKFSSHNNLGVNYKTSLQNSYHFPITAARENLFLHWIFTLPYIIFTIYATKTRVVCCTGLCTETVSEIANSGGFLSFDINLNVVYPIIFYTVKYRTYSSSVWLPLPGMVYDGVLLWLL